MPRVLRDHLKAQIAAGHWPARGQMTEFCKGIGVSPRRLRRWRSEVKSGEPPAGWGTRGMARKGRPFFRIFPILTFLKCRK